MKVKDTAGKKIKKPSKLEEVAVTREEFEIQLNERLLFAQEQVYLANGELDSIVELYNRYVLLDKEMFNLKYFKKGNMYSYFRTPKKGIGFGK